MYCSAQLKVQESINVELEDGNPVHSELTVQVKILQSLYLV